MESKWLITCCIDFTEKEMKFSFFIIVCLGLLACRPCTQVQGGLADTIVIKDTVIQADTVMLTDSGLISLFYECNDQFEIIAKDYDSLQAAFDKVPKAAKVRTVYKTNEKVVTERVPVYVEKEKIEKIIPWYCWLIIFSLTFCLILVFVLFYKFFNLKL